VRFRFFTLIFLCLVAKTSAVDFRMETFHGKKITVCQVNVGREPLELFLRDEAGAPLKSFDGINQFLEKKQRRLVFGMNAGMYEPGFAPTGLFVADGKQWFPVNLKPGSGHLNFYLKPNGVFLISESGAARIVESSEYNALAGGVRLATQSGPLLVTHGRIHPAFRAESESRLFRNGVGVPSPDTALFAVTEEPVNFYEFATFFRDGLHCPDALFLDGTVSSLFSTSLHRNDRKIDLGPIIGVTEVARKAE